MPAEHMRSSPLTGTLALSVILVLAILAAGCTGQNPPSAPAATPAPAGGGPDTITIRNFAFSPSPQTVKAGTTVTWENRDGVSHAIASDAGAPEEFRSGTLADGSSFTFTFANTGTYAYHCSIHPSMKGTVIVT